MKGIFISTILYFLIIVTASAQEIIYKNSLSFVPATLINSGLRLDYERAFGVDNLNSWVLAPQIYYKDMQLSDGYDFRGISAGRLRGAGLQFDYKRVLSIDQYDAQFYYQSGISWQFAKLFNDEGELKESIALNKLGAQFIVGYRISANQRLLFDMFTGLGFRYTFDKADNNTINTFGDYSWNFGYSGPLIVLGIKMGVVF